MVFNIDNIPEDQRSDLQVYLKELQGKYDANINKVSQANRKDAIDKLKGDDKFIDSLKNDLIDGIEADAKLNAEQKAQKILDAANLKELEVNRMSNKVTAKQKLVDAGLASEDYEGFMDVLVTDDSIQTESLVDNFVKNHNDKFARMKDLVKKEFQDGTPPPNTDPKPGEVTQEMFNKFTYDQMESFQKANPEEFKKLA